MAATDREIVARGLRTLEDRGLALLGGRSRDEAFVLRRDARPEGVGPEHAEAWHTRIAVPADEIERVRAEMSRLSAQLRAVD